MHIHSPPGWRGEDKLLTDFETSSPEHDSERGWQIHFKGHFETHFSKFIRMRFKPILVDPAKSLSIFFKGPSNQLVPEFRRPIGLMFGLDTLVS